MDKRISLQNGTLLPFPGMECTIEGVIGRGSNGIVYKAWYRDSLNAGQKHHVLIKELFPYHPQGEILRKDDGSIHSTAEGRETYEIHRRSFEWGNEIHLRLLEAHPDQIGGNINSFSCNHTLYTVLGFSGGRSLDRELDGPQIELRLHLRRMLGVLDALEAFHDSGYLHLDVSPDNILLIGRDGCERVMLIDFNSVHSIAELKNGAPLYYSTKPGYTPPEVQSGAINSICRATDLYSVLAVFYRCLMGRTISMLEMIRPTPPDPSCSPLLKDAPETVRSMVKQIFQRGLHALPEKRYQSAGELRVAFQELLDRIDGVGVTHWALWEAGKRNVAKAIRINPALDYMQQAEKMYPLRSRRESGETAAVQDCIAALSSDAGASALLVGAGGMGKTTSLLHAVQNHTRRYTPASPAVLYVPLYGWKPGEGHFIADRILEDLRFTAETASFADARHALLALMDVPLRTRDGEKPAILILLDGLNEAEGDAGELVREILDLSRRAGVRLLVTTRSDVPELPFERMTMEPLDDGDVSEALRQQGLLPPEGEAMRELLRTPLMLSIYIRAAQAGEKQLRIESRDALMDAYFSTLLDKEKRALPENAPARWQLEAAMGFVLPRIARQTARSRRALSDRELLPLIEECYKLLCGRHVSRAFPQWIGRSRDIRGSAGNAEEWYGLIVHELLWQRMGLLVRDGQDCYRIAHQILEAYLAERSNDGMRKLRRRRLVRYTATGLCAMILLAGGTFVYRNYIRACPYDETQARIVFERAVVGFGYAAGLQESARAYVDAALAGAPSELEAAALQRQINQGLNTQKNTEISILLAGEMMSALDHANEVMPWSYAPFDADAYGLLVAEAGERAASYQEFMQVIDFMQQDEAARANYYQVYVGDMDALVQTDGEILSTLYSLTCAPHMDGLRKNNAEVYGEYMKNIALTGVEGQDYTADDLQRLRENLEILRKERQEIENRLRGSGAAEAYRRRG